MPSAAPPGFIVHRTLQDDIDDFLALRPVLPRFDCFKRILRANWPDAVNPPSDGGPPLWNPWTERVYRELCDDSTARVCGNVRVKVSGLTGCASASKTHSAGTYAFLWWSISPHNSIVIFTSTTHSMIRKRMWPAVQHAFDGAYDWRTGRRRAWPFNKVESKTMIQWVDPSTSTVSDKYAIFAKAVGRGETMSAVLDLQGMHAERILLVIDELNGTPPAILQTIPNLRKGCRDFQVVLIANPSSRLDSAGQALCPRDGWSSVTESVTDWLTKGVPDWQLESGRCLRFDGRDSPNVASGEDHWPFLYTTADWARASSDTRKDTLAYWSQDRGLHPPEGMTCTVFNEVMLEKYDPPDAAGFKWLSLRTPIAFLDPAFGGNQCMLYFGLLGAIEPPTENIFGSSSKHGLSITGSKALTFPGASADEWDYLVARQAIEECKKFNVQPHCFGLDRTGTGRGVAAIISAEWSSAIIQVEFGAMGTERPSSTADGRPSFEVYANFVTEMWFSLREGVEGGQVQGLPAQARKELCMREYKWRGRKYILESKEDFKLRLLGESCDDADSAVGLYEVARRNGLSPLTRNVRAADRDWQRAGESESDTGEEEPEGFHTDGGWASGETYWDKLERRG